MIKKTVFISLFLFLTPSVLSAEDGLLPAVCKQILEPEADTSVIEVIKDHFSEKLDNLPQALVSDSKSAADNLAESLADKAESYKKPVASPQVLGTSTSNTSPEPLDLIYNHALDGAAYLLRHWLWTLGGLVLVLFGWFMR